jgi:pantoate--beta-alanine ligase
MILFKRRDDLHKYLDAQRKSGVKTGFVPTMGALHQGHVSLIRKARYANDLTICSIFINPTQFNDPADFKKYPVTLENDIEKLEEAGCDILFLPSVEEIYPGGIHEKKQYDIGYLETILEGKYRPGHFQGVSTVVHLLLSIVQPDNLYLGQKDYQQCMVIKKLLELTGMDTITIHISPTLRENDGLAMSSRNMRLDADPRKQATAIYQSLTYIKEQLKPGDLGSIKKQAVTALSEKGFKVDYIEIADAENLFIVDKWDGKQKLVALAAAYLGNVRLIDNLLLP